ncbi:uncharacterized protein [Amphiura filiformis]|uniref:uncharacterized protein isoform X1 n=1 Tax=Amphiura filiformis TaxID=82378 RepID=UPI003B216547
MRLSLPVTLLLLGVTTHVFGAHFRGGTFSWKPLNGNKVEVKYSFSFNGFRDGWTDITDGHARCNETDEAANYGGFLKTVGSLRCDGCYPGQASTSCENCVKFDPPPNGDPTSSKMSWLCTDYDEIGGWDEGGRTFEVDVPTKTNRLVLYYEACCWVDIQNADPKHGQGWKMLTEIDLNGLPNSSPVTSPRPVQLYPQGCGKFSFIIPVNDPDGDSHRCRYTKRDKGECNGDGDVCEELPYIDIYDDCTLVFDTSGPPGDYAVRVMIEDLDENGNPRSKISLSFLLRISPDTTTCDIPVIMEPKYDCNSIPVDKRFEMKVVAKAHIESQPIDRIDINNKLTGMNLLPLRPVNGHPLRKSRKLTWTPSRDQIDPEPHIVGFFAVDTAGISSGLSYVNLKVVDKAPLYPVKAKSYPSEGQIVNSLKNWRIRFNRKVQPPTQPAFIRLINPQGREVGRVDSSDPREVTFTRKDLSFDMLIEERASDKPYTLIIEEGVAIDAEYDDEQCPIYSNPGEWSVTIRYDEEAKTRPTDEMKAPTTPPRVPTKAPTKPPRVTTQKPVEPPIFECDHDNVDVNVPSDAEEGDECFIHLSEESFDVTSHNSNRVPYNICCSTTCNE